MGTARRRSHPTLIKKRPGLTRRSFAVSDDKAYAKTREVEAANRPFAGAVEMSVEMLHFALFLANV